MLVCLLLGLFFFTSFTTALVGNVANKEPMADIHGKILKDCGLNVDSVTPLAFLTGAVPIDAFFKVRRLVEVNDVGEYIQVQGGFHVTYTLDCIAEAAYKYNTTNLVAKLVYVTNSQNYWRPPVFHFNSRFDYALEKDVKNFITLKPFAGEIRYSFSGYITTACIFKFSRFPFDEQECSFFFESWHTLKQTNLTSIDFKMKPEDFVTENSGWDLKNFTFKPLVLVYLPGQDFYRFDFKISIQRRPYYYTTNLIVPCFFLTIVALSAFMLPPGEPDRAGFSVTILLSFTVMLAQVQANLPATPHEIYLSNLIIGETVAAVLITAYACLMTAVAYRDNEKEKTIQMFTIKCTKYGLADFFVFSIIATSVIILNVGYGKLIILG